MATMTCPGAGCRNGYRYNWVGGQMLTMVCGVCNGRGRVERRDPVPTRSSTDCPYGACGGECRGKGYYTYQGHTIRCSAG